MSIRNNVSLIGNLGGAPSTTTTEKGTIITEFSLATNEYFRDRDGNRQTRTMWHTIKAFGKQAEILGQYLQSGSQVAIEGRISYRRWIDKHEQNRNSTEIIVEDFTFLSPNRSGNEQVSSATTAVPVVNEPTAAASTAKSKTGAAVKRTVKSSPKAKSAAASSTRTKATKRTTAKKSPELAMVDGSDLPF